MNKLYERIDFVDDKAPYISASNLNRMSKALNDLDNRVIEGYAGAVLAKTVVDDVTALKADIEAEIADADEAIAQGVADATEQVGLAQAEVVKAQGFATEAEASADLARRTAENIGSIIVPKGSVLFENLPAVSSMAVGDMYNILNDFVTTADFIIGAGFPYPLGTNIYKTQSGLLDVFAGAVRVDGKTIDYNSDGELTVLSQSDVVARDVTYSNTTSKLSATNVQSAIDEVNGLLNVRYYNGKLQYKNGSTWSDLSMSAVKKVTHIWTTAISVSANAHNTTTASFSVSDINKTTFNIISVLNGSSASATFSAVPNTRRAEITAYTSNSISIDFSNASSAAAYMKVLLEIVEYN